MTPHGLHDTLDHLLGFFLGFRRLNVLRPQIGGHQDNGVCIVDRPALTVGQSAVIEKLEEKVKHVRMSLLHFVEQNDAVWLAPDTVGQNSSFVVTHVSGRRSHKPSYRVFLHELAHVDADEGALIIKHELGQCLGQLGLAHA